MWYEYEAPSQPSVVRMARWGAVAGRCSRKQARSLGVGAGALMRAMAVRALGIDWAIRREGNGMVWNHGIMNAVSADLLARILREKS
jgi:hypothetical protein